MEPIILAESPYCPTPLIHTPREDTIQKRIEKNKKYDYSLVYDLDHLYTSFKEAKKQSSWKKSVQMYEKNGLYNIYQLYQKLINQTYSQKGFYQFTLSERGKIRNIKAMHIEDRIVQRCLSDMIVTPVVKDYLIYDNGASMKDKGIDFCRKRLETHVHRFYRKHGRNGYILKIDFSKFFDNLLHSYTKKILYDIIQDEKTRKLIDLMINSFRQDVSYMDDDEYAQCLVSTFNSIDYQFLSKGNLTGEKMMEKSVGIGSHISQLIGIFYPGEIDNYCKIRCGLKYYGRYMDDIYIIHENKEYLQNLLVEIENISNSIGLHINKKKTQITPLHHEFTFLQIKYNLTESGHLVRRIPRKTFVRERNKLRSFKRLLEVKRITYPEVAQCYKSWRGGIEKYDCYESLQTMDKFFASVIGCQYREIDITPAHFYPEDTKLDRRNFNLPFRKVE